MTAGRAVQGTRYKVHGARCKEHRARCKQHCARCTVKGALCKEQGASGKVHVSRNLKHKFWFIFLFFGNSSSKSAPVFGTCLGSKNRDAATYLYTVSKKKAIFRYPKNGTVLEQFLYILYTIFF